MNRQRTIPTGLGLRFDPRDTLARAAGAPIAATVRRGKKNLNRPGSAFLDRHAGFIPDPGTKPPIPRRGGARQRVATPLGKKRLCRPNPCETVP